MSTQAVGNTRRSPSQPRAARTVDTVLEAAAQLLQSDGEEGLTTNRIAERAGFSIGTLYQYFPNKEAIIVALATRERDAILAATIKALGETRPGQIDDTVRTIVRALVTAFARRRKARRIVVMVMLRRWQIAPAQEGADEVARLLIAMSARGEPGGLKILSEAAAFVLTRAMLGVIRAAVLEDSPLLETAEFEDEIVRLARAFLADRG